MIKIDKGVLLILFGAAQVQLSEFTNNHHNFKCYMLANPPACLDLEWILITEIFLSVS